MHRFERCQSTESMIGDQGGFQEEPPELGTVLGKKCALNVKRCFSRRVSLSPASGRQLLLVVFGYYFASGAVQFFYNLHGSILFIDYLKSVNLFAKILITMTYPKI